MLPSKIKQEKKHKVWKETELSVCKHYGDSVKFQRMHKELLTSEDRNFENYPNKDIMKLV